jgi:hypothetical protein
MAIFLIIRSILAAENKRRDAEPQSKEMFDNAYVEQPSADGTMVKVKVDWVGLTIKLVCVELNCIRPGILGLDGQTKPRFQICVVMDPLSNAPECIPIYAVSLYAEPNLASRNTGDDIGYRLSR